MAHRVARTNSLCRAGAGKPGDASKLSIGELPGHKRRYGARGTWVWRALNAINEAIQTTPEQSAPP